jgi:hypothetical protein
MARANLAHRRVEARLDDTDRAPKDGFIGSGSGENDLGRANESLRVAGKRVFHVAKVPLTRPKRSQQTAIERDARFDRHRTRDLEKAVVVARHVHGEVQAARSKVNPRDIANRAIGFDDVTFFIEERVDAVG